MPQLNLKSRPSDLKLDESTLLLLKKRDSAFLKKLFVDVNPYLLRVCTANGLYDLEAEEILHETWDRFFFNLEQFQGRSQIRTFICGILFNKIRESRRAMGRIAYEEDAEKVYGHTFTEDGWWRMEPQDPHQMLEKKHIGTFIKECLEGLSEQQKAAFLMHEVEDERAEEICGALGVNISHLRVLLFRAKDKLKKCIEGKTQWEKA